MIDLETSDIAIATMHLRKAAILLEQHSKEISDNIFELSKIIFDSFCLKDEDIEESENIVDKITEEIVTSEETAIEEDK